VAAVISRAVAVALVVQYPALRPLPQAALEYL
jgi:hypothetical protein